MQNTPFVSVIMPVYNSREYVRTAIDSILSQTYRDFELILVDDGSSDGSSGICDEYAGRDARVVVLHQQNGGICRARNAGLKVARGRYVGFSDHDDLVKPDMLERSVAMCLEHDADLVKFGKRVQYISVDGKLLREDVSGFEYKVYGKEDIAGNYLKFRQRNVFGNVWDALFRKEIIESAGIEFDPLFKVGGEDHDFCNAFSRHVNKLVTMDDVLYVHYMRTGFSTSSKTIPGFEQRYFVLAERLWKTLQMLGCERIDTYEYANLFFESFVLPIIRYNLRIGNKDAKSYFGIIDSHRSREYFIEGFGRLSLSGLLKQSKKMGLFSYLYYKKHYRLMLALIKLRYKVLK
ncbi:glycosyltransferase [uncultured Alistipes sp.]|jgi:hypothetical protein|uniref:glycosyltransferase family 2 protein n=1 Tax=uncultured Alistipes sp. TaxID=538949 RepID=UPI0025F843A2|nr:glycosyltransferase [uncultured Alistipes sp.]